MILVLLAALVVQGDWSVRPAVPQVGDTIVVVRRLALAEPGLRVRAHPLESSREVEPLGPPLVQYEADGVTLRYAFAAFEAGSLSVTMPSLDVIHPDGTGEEIELGPLRLTVASVLPDEAETGDSLPEPRWSKPPIARFPRRLGPALGLGAGTLAIVLLWGWWRRRRGPRPSWDTFGMDVEAPPVAEWADAGEPRAVAAFVGTRLRELIEERIPDVPTSLTTDACLEVLRNQRPWWPVGEIAEVLGALDRAAFAPAVPSDILVLVDQIEPMVAACDRADREQQVGDEPGSEEESG